MATLEEAVTIVVVYFANLYHAEILGHVREAHPEASVGGILCEPNVPFELFSPAITVVSPITAPFKIAPRIPELNKLNFLTKLVLNDLGSKKTIRVLGHQTEFLKSLRRRLC